MPKVTKSPKISSPKQKKTPKLKKPRKSPIAKKNSAKNNASNAGGRMVDGVFLSDSNPSLSPSNNSTDLTRMKLSPSRKSHLSPNTSGLSTPKKSQHATVPPVKPFMKGDAYKDLRHMMFGFGDDQEPFQESVELMEAIVVEYVQNMTKQAMEISSLRGGKLDTDCFVFILRKDSDKYERVADLLRANDELRAAFNSGFDANDS